ncbi:MAG: tetratricopeptide repeat protein [Bacteroidia bacterium]|nr:tetratricopeptide repeat protein [Bacteroidia bacterium]
MRYLRVLTLGSALMWLTLPMQAQLSPYYDRRPLLEEAEALFEQAAYVPAIKKAEEFLAAETGLRNGGANDLLVAAYYIQAASAFYLERNDAPALLEAFIDQHPDNSRTPEVRFLYGKYYFNRRDWKLAIARMLEAFTSHGLSEVMRTEASFMLGYAYFMDKNPEQAVRYFDMAAAVPGPQQEDARYYQSVILYQEKNYDQAYEAFKALEGSTKYGKEIKVYLASTLLSLKRYDELYALADELVAAPKTQGKEAEVYYVVAHASFERGDYTRSISFFDQYLKARGKMNRTDYFRYGFAQYKLKNYKDATANLERAAGGLDSLDQAASYYLGFCFMQLNDKQSAKVAYQKAAQEPRGGNAQIAEDALWQYSKLCFSTEAYNEALTGLTQITEKYPRAPYIGEVQAMIGEVYLYTRDYPRSIKYLESVPRTSARVKKAYQTVCYFYGLELFERPQYRPAIEYLKKSIDNSVDENMALSARYWIAESVYRLGDFKGAENEANTFLRSRGADQNEFYARGYYSLGWAQFKQKNYPAALKSFEDYIAKATSKESPKLLVDAYLRAGDCLMLRKEYSRANAYYQKAQEKGFAFQDYAAYQQAESFYRQRQYQASAQAFDRMIRSYPESELRDNALDKISEIYATWIKDNDAAIRYANMLVTEYPRSPLASDAYVRLALAAYNNGDEAAAIQYFKKILSDYSADKKNAQLALDNLAGLLSESEFDKVLREYRSGNPDMNADLAALVFNTGKDRFFAKNYTSAIEQFTTYVRDYRNGPDYFEALVFRARSYRETSQVNKALADYKDVYSTPTNNAFTALALQEAAAIKYDLKDYNSSLELYQMLEDVASKLENRIQAWFGIAKNQKALGQYRLAEQTLLQISSNNEAEVYARTQALVEIGHCQYLSGNLDKARETFANVERDYKNAFGAESQYMIGRITYDQGLALKKKGEVDKANTKFMAVRDAVVYQSNNYPTFNYWKAKAFLVAANAYYEMGNVFQAKGTLESLIQEERFPDVQQEARERLAQINAETGSNP